MPSQASPDVNQVKLSKIQRIEAAGISFQRAFPDFTRPPADLGTNTLAAIEGVVKALSARDLTIQAIEKSLGEAAQVWDGRGNRIQDRPTFSQFQGLLTQLRTPPKASDREQPVLLPGKRIKSKGQNRGREDHSDQWETEEEISQIVGDSEEEEGGDGSETGEEGWKGDEEEETSNDWSHPDQDSDFHFTDIDDDHPPPPDPDNIDEEVRLGQDQSQAGPADRRRQQEVAVVIPLPRDDEAGESEASTERGRGGQLHLSRDFTSADNGLLSDRQHDSPELELDFPIHHSSFDSSPPASLSSPLTDLMARRGASTMSQRPSLAHPTTNRPSAHWTQLISDQDAAKKAVNQAQDAFLLIEADVKKVLQPCTYTPPPYEFAYKEADRPVGHLKRKAPHGDKGDHDNSGLDSDDGSVGEMIAEQKELDEQCIARETRALDDFKRHRIDNITSAMKRRRGQSAKCAWAEQMARVAKERVTVESRYAKSLRRFREIDADVEETAGGAEVNGADHGTNGRDTEGVQNGVDGSESEAVGGSERRGGENANGVADGDVNVNGKGAA